MAKVMGSGLPGGASLREDYTYHLVPGEEKILGAHMLEVCPSLTASKPRVEIHPLGIGGKEDPVRMVFDTDASPGVVVALSDMRDRFRLVANAVDVVELDQPLPNLPVARALWEPKPNFATSAAAWLTAEPDLELVACGSSAPTMATFGEWERVVLTETYELVDLVSAHQYFEDFGDLQEHLSAGYRMQAFIADIVSHHVKSVKKSSKQVNISFDEWNVWHMSRVESKAPTGKDWPVAPVLLEDRYTVSDAVVVGDLLITLLRDTDRVHSASLAQLVNVIAPIMTEPGGRSWMQTTFHPFALTSRHAAGTVLQLAVESPTLSGSATVVEALTYTNKDPYWQATADDSTSVLPAENVSVKLDGGRLTAELPAVSWSMIWLALR